MRIIDKLNKYCNGALPMHMPGHKRNINSSEDYDYLKRLAADIDITEIDGFDNLNNPKGIIKEAEQRASKIWGSYESFFLVNGSTSGLLASIFACTRVNKKILVARNCHKAVYNAIRIFGLEPIFIKPENDAETGACGVICPEQVERALLQENFGTVIITSPTYEGKISDIKAISEVVHKSGAVLIVDEAHGAHLGLFGIFPQNALQGGADIVIQSLHKTLPSLTSTAVVHVSRQFVQAKDVNKEAYEKEHIATKESIAKKESIAMNESVTAKESLTINETISAKKSFDDSGINREYIVEELKRALTIFTTSSPSYLLIASMDACCELLERKGEELLGNWLDNLKDFYKKVSSTKILKVLQGDREPSKIIIKGMSGKLLASIFREKYKIEVEMTQTDYVLAMTGMGDTKESLETLALAICEMDEELQEKIKINDNAALINEKGSKQIDKPGQKKVYEDVTGIAVTSTDELCSEENCADEAGTSETSASELLGISIDGAYQAASELVALDKAEGFIAAEYIWAYPPGIPVIIPGEIIDAEAVEAIRHAIRFEVELFSDRREAIDNKILVVI